MVVQPIKTRIFTAGESSANGADRLADFILEHLSAVEEGDVVAVTSKIVSLAENRVVEMKSEEDRLRYIKEESEFLVETPYTVMTLRGGMIMSSAGVDESNADGKLILLPKDPYASARQLWQALRQAWGVKKLGLVITDSRTSLMRRGSMGVAFAHAGFHAVKRYVGQPDLFGRVLQVTIANCADPLAAAAVHAMGEGSERQPIALIRGARIDEQFTEDTIYPGEIQVDIKDDVYGPLFQAVLGETKQTLNPKYEQDLEHKKKK